MHANVMPTKVSRGLLGVTCGVNLHRQTDTCNANVQLACMSKRWSVCTYHSVIIRTMHNHVVLKVKFALWCMAFDTKHRRRPE